MSDQIAWEPVRDFVYRLLSGCTTTIICGSPEWVALPDDDPQKVAALLIAGSRWCLDESIDEIHWQRDALKRAATAVSEARDWAAVAKRIRDRDQALRTGAHIPRREAS